jgi:hypothetical protein
LVVTVIEILSPANKVRGRAPRHPDMPCPM